MVKAWHAYPSLYTCSLVATFARYLCTIGQRRHGILPLFLQDLDAKGLLVRSQQLEVPEYFHFLLSKIFDPLPLKLQDATGKQ